MARKFSPSLLAVIAIITAATAGAGGVEIKVESTMPVICDADDVTVTVVQASPLIIDARMHHHCNTTHALNITYQPESLTNPENFAITLDGQAPNLSAPGSASFTNLPYTDVVQHLRIIYDGPADEREMLAQTVHVGVSY